VKILPHEHSCPSTTMVDGKMASSSWVSDRVGDWLRKNPLAGAKEVKNKLEDEFHVKVSYGKAWSGRKNALEQIHGSWEESFQLLYNFKAELERRCPESIVEIDCASVGNKMVFSKIFVALKPCIHGFIHGCRPYLAVDSTHLTGKYKGQLATAASVDGHNWLYPVAYGVFDLENTTNWEWFMTQLKRAIGALPGLAISSDAGKGLESAIVSVFPDCEHRECMRHLMTNFKKKFHGDVFDTHMWPAAKAYTREKCEYHLRLVKEAAPTAIEFLEKYHKYLWCRSKFSELTKCEYVNNNISESFNSWIKAFKDLHVVDLMDHIRQLIMITFDKRRTIGGKLQGVILPNVIQQLNAKSRNVGKFRINRGGDSCAEVSGMDSEGKPWRHAVELDRQECTCREWQLTGKPCMHAIAFICSLRGSNLEDYVHEYFSIAKFRVAYEGVIRPMTDKSQWVNVDLEFNVHPPLMKRPPGRPKKERIPGCLELRTRRQKCKRCKQFGHQERTCKASVPDDSECASNSAANPNKR
jgi:zinc finger SWIM domain-containing protein 3